jgi:hypothetical protein
MQSKVELRAGECALLIDASGKMGIELPELKPEHENASLPLNLQLMAGMFLAMQRQNEKVVQDFLEFAMKVFDEDVNDGDDDADAGGVRNDAGPSESVDEQGAA